MAAANFVMFLKFLCLATVIGKACGHFKSGFTSSQIAPSSGPIKGGVKLPTTAEAKAAHEKWIKEEVLIRPTTKGGKCMCMGVGTFCGIGDGDPHCSNMVRFDCKAGKGTPAIELENCETKYHGGCNDQHNEVDGSNIAGCLMPPSAAGPDDNVAPPIDA